MAGAGQGLILTPGQRALNPSGARRLFNLDGECPECGCEDDTIPSACGGCVRIPRQVTVVISGALNCEGCVGRTRYSGGESANGSHTLTYSGDTNFCTYSGVFGNWLYRLYNVGFPNGCNGLLATVTGRMRASLTVFRNTSGPTAGWIGASFSFFANEGDNADGFSWGGCAINWPAAPPASPDCASFSFSGQSPPNFTCYQDPNPPFNSTGGLFRAGTVFNISVVS